MEEALDLALNIADATAREAALSAVSTRLLRFPPPDAYRLWSKALRRSAEGSRADILQGVADYFVVRYEERGEALPGLTRGLSRGVESGL
jgi:hypothetical protein